jgi:SAM-dependent methyltransferase
MTDLGHCIACGTPTAESVALAAADWQINRCRHCGLGRTVHRATATQQGEELYGETYFNGSGASEHDFSDDFMRQQDRVRFTAELDEIEKLTGRGKILDIGCATGEFLFHAQQRGWRVYGYDVSAYAISQVTARIEGAVVACEELGVDTFPGERFDVITLHHVLEHVEAPHLLIQTKILPLLKKNGLLLVEVPNLDSLEARVTGAAWEDLRPEQHQWHFTPAALRRLCANPGLGLESLHTLHSPLWRTRMLTDHLWMIASLLLPCPYRGRVGRKARAGTIDHEALWLNHQETRSRGLLSLLSRHLGRPLMDYLCRTLRGKRLVLIGRNHGGAQ